FGIPPIILGALITIQLLNSYSTIITSIGGVIIAILAGLQTFLRPSELAEKHRRISETYEKIRNKFEYLLVYNSQNPQTFKEKLEAVKAEWDNLETLNVPKKIYLEAKGQVRKINIYPEQLSHLHIS